MKILDSQPVDEPSVAPALSGLTQIWTVVVKRFWLALLVFGLVCALGVWAISRRTSIYESVAEIVIETNAPRILSDVVPLENPAGPNYWTAREYLNTQYRILESRAVAEAVVARLDLESDLEFLGLRDEGDPALLQSALANVDVVQRVKSSIRIEPVTDSQVVRIVAVTGSPESAAAVANTVAEVYIDRNIERQSESVASASAWLEEQYITLEARLRASEEALVRFRVENDILTVDLAENASLQAEMQSVATQLAEARLASDRLSSLVAHIRTILDSGDIIDASVDAVIGNQLVQGLKRQYVELEVARLALSAQYLDTHPDMLAIAQQQATVLTALEREIRSVLSSYEDQSATAREMVSRLGGRLETVEAEVQRLGEYAVTYRALERNADGNRELFTIIERRLKEVDLVRNSQQNNVQVLQSARAPSGPFDPNRFTLLVLVVAFASMLAFLVPWGVELLDNTVRDRDTLERRYQLTFLGVIPTIRPSLSAKPSQRGPARGQKWNPDLFVHDFPKSNIAESCRSVRTNLMFMLSDRPLARLLVTSAGPREGKTTATCNIGTVMAQSGQRVLLVDTDMRRPRLSNAFGVKPRIGLSSVLLGDSTLEEAVLETPVKNLYLLPSGPIPPNPTELMMTDRFRSVLDELSSRYDRVIFDSPPIAPVTDAIVLSSLVDGVMLVVKSGVTRKDLLTRSVEQLRAVKAQIFGVVLNDVDLSRRGQGYYYGYYYQRDSEYYGITEAEEEESARA